MKTITITLSDTEAEVLANLTRTLDPTGSIKQTSIAKGCMMAGLVRSAKRADVDLPLEWLTTEALKHALAAVR